MIRINQLKLKPDHKDKDIEVKIRKILRLTEKDEFAYEIVKQSIDARKKPEVYYSYTVDVQIEKEQTLIKRCKSNQVRLVTPVKYSFPKPGKEKLNRRPVIIGTGPAGLFCGYMLALHGYQPILLEQGKDVDSRVAEVERFWETGELKTDCNVQFGEGGAGTFSDGKLNTLVKDKSGRNKEALSIFVNAGAPPSILYESKPHIGTDILVNVVKNMRQTIIDNGGEVHFETKVSELVVSHGKVSAVITKNGKIETDVVILAIGHSARDTFEMLYNKQILMESKSFAVGLRVEHPQKMIDYSQYGTDNNKVLPPSSYKLTAQTNKGRGVYSFCMCPGGYVVDASSEKGRLAVNGMSYSKRDGVHANSAIIVSVVPKDYGSEHPLAGIDFQRKLEEKAYRVGEGKIPVEYYGDFKQAVVKEGIDKINKIEAMNKPQIKGLWQFAPVHEIMPDELNQAFIEGMEMFHRIIPGFASDDILLSGIESRTSSPVRIHRDNKGESNIRGLYPCGEGAGYAGGITSAAMDGIKIAEMIAEKYKYEEAE